MPAGFAGALNLMAHPVGGMAAVSAVGLGLSSQAFGLWLGAVVAGIEASQRMFSTLADDGASERALLKAKVSERAKAAADLLMADANAAASRAHPAETQPPAGPKARPAARSRVPSVKKVTAARTKPAETAGKPRKPVAAARPERPDDLKAISGIGPKLEQVLNGLGLWSYAQVAALGEDEIAWLDDHLGFGGRIGRDGWVEQARKYEAAKAAGGK